MKKVFNTLAAMTVLFAFQTASADVLNEELNCRTFATTTIQKALNLQDGEFSILTPSITVEDHRNYKTENYNIQVLNETPERYRILNVSVYWADGKCILKKIENTRAPFKD